ncbi:NAD-dependent deacetylase [Calditrichota bacterium]
MELTQSIKDAANAIETTDALLITAGAGIGVDSGLPDFRGNQGFWKAYPPIAKLGISFSEMANPHWFQRDPNLAWAFYGHRLNLYRRTKPNDGFKMLLEFASKKNGNYFVFTSNVDGQFQKAGFDNDKIEECHGSIHHFQCTSLCGDDIWDASEIEVEVDEDRFKAIDPLPLCINCSSLARPNILMFGDWLWAAHRSNEQGERLSNWLKDIFQQNLKLVAIEIGAGQAVPTVRYKSESVARYDKATLIRINPRYYHVPTGNISIPLGSLEGIQKINNALLNDKY